MTERQCAKCGSELRLLERVRLQDPEAFVCTNRECLQTYILRGGLGNPKKLYPKKLSPTYQEQYL